MENRDFKYILQDTGKVYIGARYSYQEMMNEDEIPFKWKAILSHYILKEVAGDTTVENHIFYIQKTDLSYLVFHQLKTIFKMSVFRTEKLHGKEVSHYVSENYTIDQILENQELRGKRDQIIVEEMILSKFHLMTMSL